MNRSAPALALAALRLASHPHQLLGQRHIFLLSHMRANTSLLSHLMGSHPAIEGYFETHRSYLGRGCLWRQKLAYYTEHAPKRSSRWFFDKLLHNYCQLAPQVMHAPNTRLVFMLRQPDATVRSILKLYRDERPDDVHATVPGAVRYYTKRMRELEKLAGSLQREHAFLDADQLVNEPEAVLDWLSRWLGLSQPLRTEYTLQHHTGRVGLGDSSPAIHSGRILRQSADRYADIVLDDALMQEAGQAYELVRQRLLATAACPSIT